MCVYHPTRPWTNRINRFDFKHQCFGRVIKVVVTPIHCIAHVRCGDVHFAKYSRQCGASTREILCLCRRAKHKNICVCVCCQNNLEYKETSIISSVCGNMNNLRNLSSFVITPGVKSLCAPWFAVADDDDDEPPAFDDGFVLSPTVTALPPRNSLRNEVAYKKKKSKKNQTEKKKEQQQQHKKSNKRLHRNHHQS